MAQTPPILFVILDGVRKDRLSLYGHDRKTSINLDTIAEDAVVFENSYTPGPWSLPAHTSMLTGLHPSEHGMTNVFPGDSTVVPDSYETIAESLAERGYRTGGFSHNPWLGRTSDLHRRFDAFVEWDLEISSSPRDWKPTRKEETYSTLHTLLGKASRQPLSLLKDGFFTSRFLSSAERWIVRQEDTPTYTFINLMGAHTPYYPSKEAFRHLGLSPPSPFESRKLNMSILNDQIRGDGMGSTRTERIRELYDASIRDQDEKLGSFVDTLQESGLYDEMLIIIAADHGKTLGEFSRNETPTHYIRDVNVNVPLVVKLPGQSEQRRIKEPFELVQLMDFLREGEYTEECLESKTTQYALVEDYTPHTADEQKDVTQYRAVTDGSQKYIVDGAGNEFFMEGTGASESLVEPSENAAELKDALTARVDELDEKRDETGGQDSEMGEEVESQLKQLGYLN
ncbi:sulfatase [Halovenus rubra]|uniref:Sulfatase n=2 Tax=Halovenus rubra TaxID=869890 RepID=A0ACC7DW05_9EURY|nr:sulfatase [Halovenus rubra]